MVTQTIDGAVEFQFYRPGARQVLIAGDFNGWQNSFFMTRFPDGYWCARIQLAPGTYQFRYCADGEWFPDYASFGLEPGPFGWNSVVRVDEHQPGQEAPLAAPAADAQPRLAARRPLRAATLNRLPPAAVGRASALRAEHARLRIAPTPKPDVALAG